MKKTAFVLLLGFLFGSTITALLSPSAIAWYFDPPAQIGISCKAAVEWGINIYQRVLIFGGIAGVILAGVGSMAKYRAEGLNKIRDEEKAKT